MKPWPLPLICLLTLTGCTSEYLIVTSDGQLFSSQGKPELDRDTGMLEFEDSEGRKQQIPQANVKQLLER